MNEKKEISRLVILNLLIMFFGIFGLTWIGLCIKFDWQIKELDYYHILISPVIISSMMSFALIGRLKFQNIEIDESSPDYTALSEFMRTKKIKVQKMEDGSELCFVWNKYSLLPLKFIIQRVDSKVKLVIPRVVSEEIFEK